LFVSMETTCAILSGGRSTRMGRDKALVRIGGRTLVKCAYDVARKVFKRIIVVSSLHEAMDGVDAPIVEDVLPIPGSLTGIASALMHAETPYVFVLGSDMPFVTPEAMAYVVDAWRGEDIVIPRTDAGLEPMHSLYGRSCISPILSAIERRNMKVIDLLSLVPVKVLPPGPIFMNRGVSVFTNINTEEDLRIARRLLP